jgi:hypothetical protein
MVNPNPKLVYQLGILHQTARDRDLAHRQEIRQDVEARWPVTEANILHMQALAGVPEPNE